MMDWTDRAGKAKYNHYLSMVAIGHVVPNAVPTPAKSIQELAISCFLPSFCGCVAVRLPVIKARLGC
jgi:hypothetical protein